MPKMPNRSEDLTPAGERKRKSRGTADVSKSEGKPLSEQKADPKWHPIATKMWDAAWSSGQSDMYQESDAAVLFLTCESIDHWLTQGGRKSPELLRVIMQTLGTLLFTEGDRRKMRVELEKPDTGNEEFLASVSALFEDDKEAK